MKRLVLAAIVSIAAFAQQMLLKFTYEMRKGGKVTDIIIKGMITQGDDERFNDEFSGSTKATTT